MREAIVRSLERAYVWGFPYEFSARLRRNMLAAAEHGPDEHSAAAPLNYLGHQRQLSDPSYRVGVAPNVDTLYSLAWLDLDAGPFVLEVPDFDDRYYSFQVGFADTSSVSFGQRTHGPTLPRVRVQRGPRQGAWARENEVLVETHDRYAMLAGRILVDAEQAGDFARVHSLQDQVRLHRLSDNCSEGACTELDRGDDGSTDAEGFYRRLRRVLDDVDLRSIPDQVLVDLKQGSLLGEGSLPEVSVLEAAHDRASRRVAIAVGEVGTNVNGWTVNYQGSDFGLDWMLRAAVAHAQIYVTPADEALYPVVETDQDGRRLDGQHVYEIRFDAGRTPPVHFFWSLTMYHDRGFLVENPIGRYAVGDRTPGLSPEPDDSLVIRVSHEPPRDCSNWLPAPPGGFRLMLRLYGPAPDAVSRRWAPPPVVRVGSRQDVS